MQFWFSIIAVRRNASSLSVDWSSHQNQSISIVLFLSFSNRGVNIIMVLFFAGWHSHCLWCCLHSLRWGALGQSTTDMPWELQSLHDLIPIQTATMHNKTIDIYFDASNFVIYMIYFVSLCDYLLLLKNSTCLMSHNKKKHVNWLLSHLLTPSHPHQSSRSRMQTWHVYAHHVSPSSSFSLKERIWKARHTKLIVVSIKLRFGF